MPSTQILFTDALVTRCAQVIYRCLEEVGSTKAALYLKAPGEASFEEICHFGWPRGTHPPERIAENDPLCLRIQREKRPFAVNDAASAPELAPFGGSGARFFLAPIYLTGDWIGILLQRDPMRGDDYSPEKAETLTLRICQTLMAFVRESGLYGTTPGLETGDLLPAAAEGAEETPWPARSAPDGVRTSQMKADLNGQAPGERRHAFESPAAGFATPPWGPSDHAASDLSAPMRVMPLFQRRWGSITPELRAYFWESSSLITQILSADGVALWMEDPEENRPILCFSPRPLPESLQQQVMICATYHLEHASHQDLRLLSKAEQEGAPEMSGTFATYLPMLMNERGSAHDLLMAFRLEDRPFSMAEIEILQRFARILGMQMEETRFHERYHQAFLSVSHRILKSAESRLPHLRGHGMATARLARDLALKLGLPSEEVESASIAAALHDVGMLLLDPAMVQRPWLTDEERTKMRQHPDLAATFLKGLRFPFDVIRTIRHHHERWDGYGYPEHLQESAIPIGSRIIHVIEAYEVMTSGKSYRQPIGFHEALDELRKEAGYQFDPAVVEAFCELMARKGRKA